MNYENFDYISWLQEQSWAGELERCPQNPVWHGEGNVLNHSIMVYNELVGLEGFQALDSRQQMIVSFAAVLHDIGKVSTTVVRDGAIVSPGHGRAGALRARTILSDLGIDLGIREEIVRLICYHMKPVHVIDRDPPLDSAIWLSHKADTLLLYYLALADNGGRISSSRDEGFECIHLWKALCEENGFFGEPYRFVNSQARFLFYRNELSSLHYEPYEEYSCSVYMMSGLPGAGKDYWIENNLKNYPVVSFDNIREEMGVEPTGNQGKVIQAGKEQVKENLRNRRDFVLNATNITSNTRKKWIDLLHQYGAKVNIVYVEPAYCDILSQNGKRKKPVPENVIGKLFRKLEVPEPTEAHSVLYV